jgi:hypothetical protein
VQSFSIVFLQWPQQEQPRGLQHRQAHGSRFLLVEPVPEYKTPLSASEDEHSVGRQRRSKKSGSQETRRRRELDSNFQFRTE